MLQVLYITPLSSGEIVHDGSQSFDRATDVVQKPRTSGAVYCAVSMVTIEDWPGNI